MGIKRTSGKHLLIRMSFIDIYYATKINGFQVIEGINYYITTKDCRNCYRLIYVVYMDRKDVFDFVITFYKHFVAIKYILQRGDGIDVEG